MPTSNVDIANSALIKLGAPQIVALTDSNKSARTMNAIFHQRRKTLIAGHPWNFSTFRKELAKTVNTPAFEYTAEFVLSSDILRIFDTDLPDIEPWEVEFNSNNQKVVVCNSSTLKVKYAKDVTDPSKFPFYFVEAFAFDLAAQTCYAITQSRSFATDMYAAAKRELAEARSMNAQEATGDEFGADDWTDVRY